MTSQADFGYTFVDSNKVLQVRISEEDIPFAYYHVSFDGHLDNTRSSQIYNGGRETISQYLARRLSLRKPIALDFGQVTGFDTSGLALIFDLAKKTRVSPIFIVHPKSDVERSIKIAAANSPGIVLRFPIREHLIHFFAEAPSYFFG